ncbi:conserved hypothetical protein [Candidatus Roizmanbacteria bacterium]|nr:conserved hypothetical protein [Candidatus Roizmanbacteria bacterium]
MWNKKDVFFLVIIMLQLITIFYFGVKIIRNKSQGIIVTPIKKDAVVKGISSKLKYFYINNPDTTIEDIVPWTKEIVKYTINSDGLNETTNYLVDKPTNVFRIVTLGDSFTFGQFINTVDNWTELIEDKLQNLICKNISKFEVINLGTEDYDIQYSVEKFTDLSYL